MGSLEPSFIAKMSFDADDAATLAQLGLGRGRQELFTHQTPQMLETLRQAAVVESTTSSNRLEGITAPAKRVRALVLKSSNPQNRPEQEIAGYRDALNFLHASYPYLRFSTDLLRQLHTLTYRYQAKPGGSFKAVDNEIVERAPDGEIARVRFRPVSAEQTPEALAQLVAAYTDAVSRRSVEALVVVPLTILDFLCIHPFVDGNGRVSRLLTLLLLYRHDFHLGRYISLERIFEESKESYYNALEASSSAWHEGAHDPMPWVRYFWGVLLRAFEEFEQRVSQAGGHKANKSEQLVAAIRRQVGPFAISDIEASCPGISRELARRVIRRLRDEGVIIPQGRGRNAKWLRIEDRASADPGSAPA